jgi:hypothetical protein
MNSSEIYSVWQNEYACAPVSGQLHAIPNSLKEATASPEWRHWKTAEELEVAQLTKLNCWTVEIPTSDRKIIGGRWTYARNTDTQGNVVRWKARWVLRGFNQIASVDYDESSSSVIKMTSVRAICTVAAARNMVLEQADAINAYSQPNAVHEPRRIHRQGPGTFQHDHLTPLPKSKTKKTYGTTRVNQVLIKGSIEQ